MKLSTPLSLAIQLCLGFAAVVSAQTIMQSVPDGAINDTDLSPAADPDPASTTTTYNTVTRCGGCAVAFPGISPTDTSTFPSSSTAVGRGVFLTSSASGSSTIIPQPTSFGTDDPNTNAPVVAGTTPIARRPRLSKPAVIGIVIGLAFLAVLVVAAVFLLLRGRSRNKRHGSKVMVDPEAPASAEEIRVAGAGTAVTQALSHPADQELTGQKLAHLEHQARVLQLEIEALKRANRGYAECECDEGKGYTVDAAQREKFDFFAARARGLTLKTYREHDSAEDVPPDYESTTC